MAGSNDRSIFVSHIHEDRVVARWLREQLLEISARDILDADDQVRFTSARSGALLVGRIDRVGA